MNPTPMRSLAPMTRAYDAAERAELVSTAPACRNERRVTEESDIGASLESESEDIGPQCNLR